VNIKELLKLPMVICKSCGWEIGRGQIEPMCDDCEQLQEREGASNGN
jgi:hypothetical protein